MHRRSILLAVVPSVVAACGTSKHPATDAGRTADAAASDAAACPIQLLTGGSDVTAQGWSVVMQPPATLSNATDHVELQTSTSSGAKTGGQLLVTHPGAVEIGKPFKLQVVMQVVAVNPHNRSDAGAAILGSFSGAFGTPTERDQMIYLDASAIGWADGSLSFPATVTDGAYHTYELSVDAGRVATFRVDGIQALTRTGFTTSGTIAVGDQTNDQNVDSTLRIRSVTRLCP